MVLAAPAHYPQAPYSVFLKHLMHGITIICPQILFGQKSFEKIILSLNNFKQTCTLQFATGSFSILPTPLHFAYLYHLPDPWRHLIYAS